MRCECEGLKGWDLVKCLSPPKGEYEVELEISKYNSIVINQEGFFLRRKHYPSNLPLIESRDSKIDTGFLEKMSKLSVDEILCIVLDKLAEAATHGSIIALEKLEKCEELIAEVREKCE